MAFTDVVRRAEVIARASSLGVEPPPNPHAGRPLCARLREMLTSEQWLRAEARYAKREAEGERA